MPDDAIYVYCNISNEGETCIFPDIHSSQMPNIPWKKENNKNDWYSRLRGGFKVRLKFFVFEFEVFSFISFRIFYTMLNACKNYM